MFQSFRSREQAVSEPLATPPLDLQVPGTLATATFGVG